MVMNATQIIERLQRTNDERAELIRQLAMWAKVEEQGINPEEVATFSFRPDMMTLEDRRDARIFQRKHPGRPYTNTNPYGWPQSRDAEGRAFIRSEMYNCVTLKNERRVKLSPMIERP